jgi:hypothetical protein
MSFIKKLSFTRFPKEDKQRLIDFFHSSSKNNLSGDVNNKNKNNDTANSVTFNNFLKK